MQWNLLMLHIRQCQEVDTNAQDGGQLSPCAKTGKLLGQKSDIKCLPAITQAQKGSKGRKEFFYYLFLQLVLFQLRNWKKII